MIVDSFSDLPEEYGCNVCGATKPIGEMVVVQLRQRKKVMVRRRCKKCNNARERGHRREYKTKYLRRWRKNNAELNESYWRQSQADKRVELNARAYTRFRKNHAAILIQGRMCRYGMSGQSRRSEATSPKIRPLLSHPIRADCSWPA